MKTWGMKRMKISKKGIVTLGYKKHKSYEEKWGYIRIDDKWYSRGLCDGKPILEEVPSEEIAFKVDLVKKFVKVLKSKLDTEAILMERLMKISPKDYEILDKLLLDKNHEPKKEKERPEIKTRAHRCVDMKIGDDYWFQIC